MFGLRTAIIVPVKWGDLLLESLPASAAPNDLQASSLDDLSRNFIGGLC